MDDNGNGTFDSEQNFVYDGSSIVLVYDDAGSLTNRYLHGPAVDQIFADEDALGDVLWSLDDNQRTVRDQLDNDGVKVNHLKYDAFGNITAQSDPTIEVLFAYTGREWDPDAELYFYRARWYDPAVGRFISEDPLSFAAGDANLSRYVTNSSPNYVDPSGLEDENAAYWGAFGDSITDSVGSMQKTFSSIILDKYYNEPKLATGMMTKAYKQGPLAKTTGTYHTGVKAALGTATVVTGAAVIIGAVTAVVPKIVAATGITEVTITTPAIVKAVGSGGTLAYELIWTTSVITATQVTPAVEAILILSASAELLMVVDAEAELIKDLEHAEDYLDSLQDKADSILDASMKQTKGGGVPYEIEKTYKEIDYALKMIKELNAQLGKLPPP